MAKQIKRGIKFAKDMSIPMPRDSPNSGSLIGLLKLSVLASLFTAIATIQMAKTTPTWEAILLNLY